MGEFPHFFRSMEVRSEPGIVSGREPFSVGLQKSPVPVQSQPSMRLTFASDGTAIYKPVTATSPTYQGASGGGGNGGGGGGGNGGGGGSTGPAATDAPSQQPDVSHGLTMNLGEPLKRKRGRPRKYGPDGTMTLVLSPGSAVPPFASGYSPSPLGAATPASAGAYKAKPRSHSSVKKQQMAALGSAGIGFTPHVITVKAGEDVSSKIMSFSQCGPRAVCILSANGAISNVTLRQASSCGGTVTYEGRFEILSLSGSFLYSESGGQRSRTGGLSVSLAGPDGRVLGGGVGGILTAASPVQVVLGSFMAEGQKQPKQTNVAEPAYGPKLPLGGTVRPGTPPSHGTQSESFRAWQTSDVRKESRQATPSDFMYGARAPSGGAAGGSPPSHGTESESSGEPGSPLNHSSGACNNSNQQGMTNLPWK